MGSCISNDDDELASTQEIHADDTNKLNTSTNTDQSDNDVNHNHNLSDIDISNNHIANNHIANKQEEDTPISDIGVDQQIVEDEDNEDNENDNDTEDSSGAGFPYNPNGSNGILSDEWKYRKFHRTIYHFDLMGYIDDINDNDYIVIDVRDPSLDFVGGHIKGAINIYHEDFINKLPFIVSKYNTKSKLIIHCMYSQSRGPMCCQWYCLGIESLLKNYNKKQEDKSFEQSIQENSDFEILKTIDLDENMYNNLLNQGIYLLKDGFRGWVNKFKDNDKYVEDFDINHWNYETVGGKKELYHKNDW